MYKFKRIINKPFYLIILLLISLSLSTHILILRPNKSIILRWDELELIFYCSIIYYIKVKSFFIRDNNYYFKS